MNPFRFLSKKIKHHLEWSIDFIKSLGRRFKFGIVLSILCFLATYLFLFVITPDTRNIEAPVIVASSDCNKLPNLSITVIDKKNLKIDVTFEECLENDLWQILVQKPDNVNRAVVYYGNDSLILETSSGGTTYQGYFRLTEAMFKKQFTKNENDNGITLSYVLSNGLHKRSFSKYFISVLFIPVKLNSKENYPVSIEVIAPSTFLLSSSIPEAFRIFVLKDGISYSFKTIDERSGILLIFDDLSAEANKEIIVLFATTILGFVIGILLERFFKF